MATRSRDARAVGGEARIGPDASDAAMPRTLKHRIGQWFIPLLPVNRRTFDVLRFELNAAVTSLLARVSPGRRRAIARIRRGEHLKVNLGSGGRGAYGWVNVDVARHVHDVAIAWDVRRGLPFADAQVSALFAEHVVEHLEFREDVPQLLREARRVLEPGGTIRLVVPDAGRFLLAYHSDDPDQWRALGFDRLPDDMPTPMTLINHVFHQNGEHQFAYDFATLRWALEAAGFTRVRRSSFGESCDGVDWPEWNGHAPYSLYVEATRPATSGG